jgi:NTE family protein
MNPSKSQFQVILALQGGGALGAYHHGVFERLTEANVKPDFLAGISIGAIVSAIIAGNEPSNRISALTKFWKKISRPAIEMPVPTPYADYWQHLYGAWQAVMFGQPNFFIPWGTLPWFSLPGTARAISFYDTSPLKQTLNELVDFDLINSKRVRLIIGAVNVRTGKMTFFDNWERPITVEMVMASAALPPGFPAVKVDGDDYWDGGCYSNTLLDEVLTRSGSVDKWVIMPQLFNPAGLLPRTLDEAELRKKQIQYSERSNAHLEKLLECHDLRAQLSKVLSLLTPEQIKELGPEAEVVQCHELKVTRLMLHLPPGRTSWVDTDFSRYSLNLSRTEGYKDMDEVMACKRHPNRSCCGFHCLCEVR